MFVELSSAGGTQSRSLMDDAISISCATEVVEQEQYSGKLTALDKVLIERAFFFKSCTGAAS